MAVWIYFEPMWPKETASISVFHKSMQVFDAPCYSCDVLHMIAILIRHGYRCGDAPWSVHLLIVLEFTFFSVFFDGKSILVVLHVAWAILENVL